MFDVKHYFDLAAEVLASNRQCYSIESRVTIEPDGENSWENWVIIRWEATIKFHAGHQLKVFETYGRNQSGEVIRRFSYHFWDAENPCIFRFDTHGNEYPLDVPCHVHLDCEDDVFESGHGRLKGYALDQVDFMEAMRLAHRRIAAKNFPWD